MASVVQVIESVQLRRVHIPPGLLHRVAQAKDVAAGVLKKTGLPPARHGGWRYSGHGGHHIQSRRRSV